MDPARHEAPLFHHRSAKGNPTQTSGHVSSSSNSDRSPEEAGLPESSHLSAAQLSCLAHSHAGPWDPAQGGGGEGPWRCTQTGGKPRHASKELGPRSQAGAQKPGLESQPEVAAATGLSPGCHPQGGRNHILLFLMLFLSPLFSR